jgi:hypothetical protein
MIGSLVKACMFECHGDEFGMSQFCGDADQLGWHAQANIPAANVLPFPTQDQGN